jgi:hypothetical protein
MVGRTTAATITGPVNSIINLFVSFIFLPPFRPQTTRRLAWRVGPKVMSLSNGRHLNTILTGRSHHSLTI